MDQRQVIVTSLSGYAGWIACCWAPRRQQVARADTKRSPRVFFRINGSIITAAPSSHTASLMRHAQCCCLWHTFYFGNSTWHSELFPLIPLRMQPQVVFIRANTLTHMRHRQRDEDEGLPALHQCEIKRCFLLFFARILDAGVVSARVELGPVSPAGCVLSVSSRSWYLTGGEEDTWNHRTLLGKLTWRYWVLNQTLHFICDAAQVIRTQGGYTFICWGRRIVLISLLFFCKASFSVI